MADEAKKLPNIFSPHVKIHSKTENATVFRVLGVPYYGKEELGFKDLHGEFFSKHTDYAMDGTRTPLIKEVISYYDHAYNDRVGVDPIGKATFVKEDEDGQIWDIEIQRAYRYLDMLEMMASKGLLGASSQPVQSAVKINWETGFIEKWPVAEMSLTPTPANPLAVASMVKSFMDRLEDTDMARKDPTQAKGEEKPVIETPVVDATVEETPVVDAPVQDETPVVGDAPSLEDEINDAFKPAKDEVELDLNEVAKTLGLVLKAITALDEKIDGVVTVVAASDDKIKSAVLEVSGVKNGLKALALNVAKSMRFEFSSEAERLKGLPAEEQEVEQRVRSKISSLIPDNAPGRKVGN